MTVGSENCLSKQAYYFSYFENKLYQTTRNIINLIRISIKPKKSNEHIRDVATNLTELSDKPCITCF